MNVRQLYATFRRWREKRKLMALATVTATQGSTYSKTGARMLLTYEGESVGLVGGGCLEPDLHEHAREVMTGGAARTVTYDMRNRSEDEMWGLGLGCDGAMRILLQKLDVTNDYHPLAGILECLEEGRPGAVATVVASTAQALPVGTSIVVSKDRRIASDVPMPFATPLIEAARDHIGARRAEAITHLFTGAQAKVLLAAIEGPPRLLILGGGPDCLPLVRLAVATGWHVTVADHRPAYVERLARSGADRVREIVPAELHKGLPLARFRGAMVMSHHLATDAQYLRQVLAAPIPYVGLLGPRARRERLLERVGADRRLVQGRLFGPAGLDIGADDPETIALAIVAELTAVTRGRAGGHFA